MDLSSFSGIRWVNTGLFSGILVESKVIFRGYNNNNIKRLSFFCHLWIWCHYTVSLEMLIIHKACMHIHSRHSPIFITGTEVECDASFKDLSWHHNTSVLVRKAQQHLYFLKRLNKVQRPPKSLYCCTVGNILSNCVTVRNGSSTVSETKQSLQKVMKTSQHIIGAQLPTIEHLHHMRCLHRARNIIRDSSHPGHKPLNLLSSQRRYRNIRTRTSRLRNSFIPTTILIVS